MRALLFAFLLFAAPAFARAPAAIAPPTALSQPETAFPAPDRPVAPIVSDGSGDEQTRDEEKEAERVLDVLGVKPGMTVADVGAGAGYYSRWLSRRVGSTGRVYAQDIMPAYLARLAARLKHERIGNVTVVRGLPHDPRLPANALDLVIMVRMYHEVTQPYGLMWHLRSSLKPGARIAIVERDRQIMWHGTPPRQLRCEMAAGGFREVAFHQMTDEQYVAVFEPISPAPAPSAIRPCDANGRPKG
jgi:predicted methyltransferase